MDRPAATRAKRAIRDLLDAALPSSLWVTRGARAGRDVHLTFDDGPHPIHTPAVLDALARQNARATFFLLGEAILRQPALVRRIVAEGHGIGNHTFRHARPDLVTWRVLLRELEATDRALIEVLGTDAPLFRPPHGQLTASKLLASWWHGSTVVLWSLDPQDFRAESADQTVSFLEEHPPQAGDVVLLHDVNPRAASVVEQLVPRLRRRGLTCAPLPRSRP